MQKPGFSVRICNYASPCTIVGGGGGVLGPESYQLFKVTVRPDSLDRPWKGHQTLMVFNFLILICNIWKDFWASLYKKYLSSFFFFGIRDVGTQIATFSAKPVSNNAGESTLVLWITAGEKNIWRILTSRNPNQNSTVLWRIFSSNTSEQANRKDFIQAVCRIKNEEIGSIFVFSGSELWTHWKNARSK